MYAPARSRPVREDVDGCYLPPRRPPDLPSALRRFRVVRGGKESVARCRLMCGRIIVESSGPVRYAIVDGMNARDSRVRVESEQQGWIQRYSKI